MYDLKSQLISDHKDYDIGYIKNQILTANRLGHQVLEIKRDQALSLEFKHYLSDQGIQVEVIKDGYRFDWSEMLDCADED